MKRILFLLICLPIFGWSQSVIVSGNVSDVTDVVPGVNIIEKGTSNGTTTDFNGNYEISVSSNTAILVFSYVGYASQEVTVGEQTTINVRLAEDAQALDAVVVRGFSGVIGKARKRTGSIQITPETVTAFNSDGIEKAGINNVSSFANLVPNLKLSETQAVGVNSLVIRGIPQI
ncbi:MAG: carboxypeptidase-like regulatory domain-containing protein, partial [Flavobacteriales bacterium]